VYSCHAKKKVIVANDIDFIREAWYAESRKRQEKEARMNITLKELIGLVKELPEEAFEDAFEKLKEAKERVEAEKEAALVACLGCGGPRVVRNGKRNGRQAYLCKDCGKSFVETATSAIAHSHSGETVWKQVIRDTVEGVSLDKTASALDLAHSTVFNMRHKILYCVEQAILAAPVVLDGVCEADETYVLESVKGRKIPGNYHRKPRKHGAKASKSGISDEYICLCTSVDNDNRCTASAVNRATPSKAEIEQVFGDKVTPDTVILCDGNKNYDVLERRCTVAHVKHPNKVNGFHGFIKERIRAARGVATLYLTRYAALFSQVFGDQDKVANKIFDMMTSRNGSFSTINTVKSQNLLTV
jgi:transposase-like protein